MEKIIILGAGGYAQQLLWVINQISSKEVIGFVDETITEEGRYNDLPIRKTLELYENERNAKNFKLICATGNIPLRKRWVETYQNDYEFTTVIDPSALVSPDINIGKNVIILGQTVCSVECVIEDHVNINWFCLISHHTRVGSYTNISSGVRLTGHARIGQFCDIGTNVTIIPQKKVGDHCILGAGAVVIMDIPAYSIAVGIPAKVIKTRNSDA